MQILSQASERYLSPIPKEKLGKAILKVSLKTKQSVKIDSSLDHKDSEAEEDVRALILEVYEENEDGVKVNPKSLHALHFVPRRFNHGYQRRSSHGQLYETYEVPATDYSLFLILHAWQGTRVIADNAKAYLRECIVNETKLSLVAERSAKYKQALTPLLLNFEQQKNESLFDDSIVPIPPEEIMSKDSLLISSLKLNPYVLNSCSPLLTLYQKVAASNAIDTNGYCFYMQPGAGKTAPAIATMDYVAASTQATSNRPSRTLILVPKNIRFNWCSEIDFFSTSDNKISILQGVNSHARTFCLVEALIPPHVSDNSLDSSRKLSDMSVPVLPSTNKEDKTISGNVDNQASGNEDKKKPTNLVVIANYEAAVGTELVSKIEWDLLIIDESHSIANNSTKRTKFIVSLRDNSAKHLILSGTPIRNNPFDLFPQFEVLEKGASGFSSFSKFKEFFGVWKNIPGKGIRVLGELQNIPLLQERLAKRAFILTLEEAIPSLPPCTEDILECTLTPEQIKVYRDVATKLQAYLSDADQKINDVMVIKSHLVKLLRLAEITSGYAKSDESGIYKFDPNPKLELLVTSVKEFLEDNPQSKVQVWCHFRENIKQIFYRFNNVEKIPSVVFYGDTKDSTRLESQNRFNCDPATKLFIGSPAAGGVGLNLLGFDPYNPAKYKTNCEWAIFYSQNWSSVSRRQAMARARRKGTRMHMRYTDIVVPGSIDMMIRDRVRAKIEMALSIEDVRKILTDSLKPLSNGD